MSRSRNSCSNPQNEIARPPVKKEFYQFGLQSGELRSGVKIGRIALTWPPESKDLNRFKVSPACERVPMFDDLLTRIAPTEKRKKEGA